MIGNDSTTDIAGATALGMDGFYVRTEISPENDPTPDCRFVFEDGDIGHVLELIKE
jgi:putative hydrolase of the HAD superfamily